MTDKPKLRIIRSYDDDEGIQVYVGVKYIGSANHDEHGWAGISMLENTAKNIAAALGVEVEEVYKEDDGEGEEHD